MSNAFYSWTYYLARQRHKILTDQSDFLEIVRGNCSFSHNFCSWEGVYIFGRPEAKEQRCPSTKRKHANKFHHFCCQIQLFTRSDDTWNKMTMLVINNVIPLGLFNGSWNVFGYQTREHRPLLAVLPFNTVKLFCQKGDAFIFIHRKVYSIR